MNCKFCNAEMEEGVTLCPVCGKDNLEELTEKAEMPEEAVTEAQEEEVVDTASVAEEAAEEPAETPKKKTPKWLVALAIVGAIAIAAVLGTAVYFGIRSSMPPAGSYSVSDSKAEKARDTVVATVGDVELTNSALQVYYWQAVNEYQNSYAYYMNSSALDLTKPLDEQFYDEEAGITWQKYFLDGAL